MQLKRVLRKRDGERKNYTILITLKYPAMCVFSVGLQFDDIPGNHFTNIIRQDCRTRRVYENVSCQALKPPTSLR